MKTKSILFFSLAVIAVFAVSLSYAFRNIESLAKPEPKFSSASLPSLVRYYESQLDPSIPRITVTAEHDGERYELPYDAAFVSGDGEPQAAVNRTWFVNLINNFWSLPELVNEKGGYGGMSPAQFTISFSEQPEGEVSIIDY